MANVLYPSALQKFLEGGSLFWLANDIRVMLVKQGFYAYDEDDVFLVDVNPTACDNGRSAALTGKTSTDGVADANDVIFNATSAVACDAIILFQHTGNDASARLIAYMNVAGAGLPFTPSGAGVPITVVWANTDNRIFKL